MEHIIKELIIQGNASIISDMKTSLDYEHEKLSNNKWDYARQDMQIMISKHNLKQATCQEVLNKVSTYYKEGIPQDLIQKYVNTYLHNKGEQ